MDNLKAEQLGSAKWRVLAIPFGGPFKGGRDSDGEYFSPNTDIKAHWFKARPVLFHHGMDTEIEDEDIGTAEEPVKRDDGWWVDLWLHRSSQYWARINQLLAAGKMYGSSGTIGYLVKKAKDGEILKWPYAEQTLTPTPANFLSRLTASKAIEHFNSAGIELDATLKALLDELDARSDDLTPDLSNGGESDLSLGGDEAAMKRLVALTNAQLARLRAL